MLPPRISGFGLLNRPCLSQWAFKVSPPHTSIHQPLTRAWNLLLLRMSLNLYLRMLFLQLMLEFVPDGKQANPHSWDCGQAAGWRPRRPLWGWLAKVLMPSLECEKAAGRHVPGHLALRNSQTPPKYNNMRVGFDGVWSQRRHTFILKNNSSSHSLGDP